MKKIALVSLAIMALIASASANVYSNVQLVSGLDGFTDTLSISGHAFGTASYGLSNAGMGGENNFDFGSSDFSFSEVTTATWLKGNGLSDDPYDKITKRISNVGSGKATSSMSFSDMSSGFELLSGFNVDKNVDSSYGAFYATDFQSWKVDATISTTKDRLDFLAGTQYNRYNGDLTNIFKYEF